MDRASPLQSHFVWSVKEKIGTLSNKGTQRFVKVKCWVKIFHWIHKNLTFKDSKIQRIQRFKDSKIQRFKDSKIQGFKDSKISFAELSRKRGGTGSAVGSTIWKFNNLKIWRLDQIKPVSWGAVDRQLATTSDFWLPSSDLRPLTSDLCLPTSDLWLPTSDLWHLSLSLRAPGTSTFHFSFFT